MNHVIVTDITRADRDVVDAFAALGVATVHEAQGRTGYAGAGIRPLQQGTAISGSAITVHAAPGDNLMVHAAIAHANPGDVLVLTMPVPRPVALVGDLLATQAKARGVAGLLIDGSVRDVEELVELGLPIWARWIRVRGAGKDVPGTIDEPVMVGGARIAAGDTVVLDADGAAVIAQERVEEVLEAAKRREEKERVKRAKLQAGELSYDLDNLRARVE